MSSLRSSSMLQLCLVLILSAAIRGVNGQACSLTVPADPLSAIGLSTAYTVTGCVQQPLALGGTATFVQATIVDMDTGALYAYTPLVLSAAAPNNVAQIAPVVPKLPKNYTAGLWFGTNGGSTTLIATSSTGGLGTTMNSLSQGNCVNGGGSPYSIFGQFASCNGHQFFDAVYALVNKGLIQLVPNPPAGQLRQNNQVPMLGTTTVPDPNNANQFLQCPTTHSFSIVDQDQSDNTDAKYLFLTASGNLAVATTANQNTLTATHLAFSVIDNGSDELLITLVQSALGCTPYQILDLSDPTGQTFSPTLATNELQAILSMTTMPRAFIPATDPMVVNTVTGLPDIGKLNAYRTSVGQSALTSTLDASTKVYCDNMYSIGSVQITAWLPFLLDPKVNPNAPIPAPDFGVTISNTLAGVLIGRFGAAVNSPNNGGNLNCPGFLGIQNPFTNFQPAVGTLAPAACPAPLVPATCGNPTGANIAQILGVAGLVADNTGQMGVDVPAGLTISAAGVISPTPSPGSTTTATTTSTAFSGTWFAAGVGVMAGIVLLAGGFFYLVVWKKQQEKFVTTNVSMNMNRF